MSDVLTRSAIRQLVAEAESLASALRAGEVVMRHPTTRRETAEMLDRLAQVARRRLDPDYTPEPDQYHGGEDLVTDETWAVLVDHDR